MKTILLLLGLLPSIGRSQIPAVERCEANAAHAIAPGACAKQFQAPAPAAPLPARAEAQEGSEPKQQPNYKAPLKQQCDAMSQALKAGKLGASQEAQLREQHRAFRCG